MSEIKSHPWFLKDLPKEMLEGFEQGYSHDNGDDSLQSEEDILRIIKEAKVIGTKESKELGYSDERNHESELEPYPPEAKELEEMNNESELELDSIPEVATNKDMFELYFLFVSGGSQPEGPMYWLSRLNFHVAVHHMWVHHSFWGI